MSSSSQLVKGAKRQAAKVIKVIDVEYVEESAAVEEGSKQEFSQGVRQPSSTAINVEEREGNTNDSLTTGDSVLEPEAQL